MPDKVILFSASLKISKLFHLQSESNFNPLFPSPLSQSRSYLMLCMIGFRTRIFKSFIFNKILSIVNNKLLISSLVDLFLQNN